MASEKYSNWKKEFDDFCKNLGFNESPEINIFHQTAIEDDLREGKSPDIYREQRILSENDNFAVYRDPEGVCKNCEFYKNLLNSMNIISKGRFNFRDIREEWFWEEDEVFIKIEFTSNGESFLLWVKRNSDFARYEFIELINIALGLESGCRFELTGYPDEWVVVFVDTEKKEILKKRGWEFTGFKESLDEAIYWQAQQNSKYDYSKHLLFFLEKKEFRDVVNQNPWLLYYRGSTYFKLGDENKAWCDWSVAMNSQDKEILDLIRKSVEK